MGTDEAAAQSDAVIPAPTTQEANFVIFVAMRVSSRVVGVISLNFHACDARPSLRAEPWGEEYNGRKPI